MNALKTLRIAGGALSFMVLFATAAVGQTEVLVEKGDLPGYRALQYKGGEETLLDQQYLLSLPVMADDRATTGVIFPEVPSDSPYAALSLIDLVRIAEGQNFGLINSERSVRIARSNTASAGAAFIPFIDLVANSRVRETQDVNADRTVVAPTGATAVDPLTGLPTAEPNTITTKERERVYTNTVGVESGVSTGTGGSISATGNTTRTDTFVKNGAGLDTDAKGYSSNAEVRLIQPLLRGGGYEIGMADLRQAKISEIDSILGDQIQRRDTVLSVIDSYFSILQSARQLEVSRLAISIRLQFLEDTQSRFDVGYVDQSEILRAEINYLNELETAIGRRRTLDNSRDQMLILLGLPLETAISFVDITDELARRGRVAIPEESESVEEALNSRQELLRADLAVASAEIGRMVARNGLLPQLDLDGGVNRFDSGAEYTEAVGFEDSGWDLGANLRVPIPNIQRRESHRRSVLSLEQQRTNRLSRERSLVQEVYSTRRNVLTTEAQLTILSKSVEQARKSLALINGRFEVGFADVTEVRLAQDDLFNAETRYSNALLSYQTTLARLYVALGRPLS